MLIKHNKHFLWTRSQHPILEFQLLRPYTNPGHHMQPKTIFKLYPYSRKGLWEAGWILWKDDSFSCLHNSKVYILTSWDSHYSKSQVVLNLKEKIVHFKKHWPEHLYQDVLDCAEEVVCSLYCDDFVYWERGLHKFKECYEEMYGSGPKLTAKKNKTTGIKSLLHELSNDEDEDIPTIPSSSDDSDKPY